MPDEEMWDSFFSPEKTLALLGLDADTQEVAEFGCGYGTFTLAAAWLTRGMVHAFDIEPEMFERAGEVPMGKGDQRTAGSARFRRRRHLSGR